MYGTLLSDCWNVPQGGPMALKDIEDLLGDDGRCPSYAAPPAKGTKALRLHNLSGHVNRRRPVSSGTTYPTIIGYIGHYMPHVRPGPQKTLHVGLYPIVSSQYSETTLYELVPYFRSTHPVAVFRTRQFQKTLVT